MTCWPAALNVTFSSEYGEMSALYGAAGVVHEPELTLLLLEAGADPDDGESVYHATEAASPECLRLLIDHGATLEPIHLAHALDDERPEHVRLLLEGGVEATELLPFAVRRGRGPATLKLLVDYGAVSNTGRARIGANPSGCAPPTSTRGCATPALPPRRWPASVPRPASTPTTSRWRRSPGARTPRRRPSRTGTSRKCSS